ncbi:MAG: hypothetical protein ACYDCO_02465 [Armatimonadota bacterium]
MPKVLSIRVPEDLYNQVNAIAAERAQSINSLVNDALQQIVTKSERESLYEAFTYIGQRFGSRVTHTLPTQQRLMAERQSRRKGK